MRKVVNKKDVLTRTMKFIKVSLHAKIKHRSRFETQKSELMQDIVGKKVGCMCKVVKKKTL